MNDELQKRLVATHNQIDPAMVTAEDLVRAIRDNEVIEMAIPLGFEIDTPFSQQIQNGDSDNDWIAAAEYIANLITLPEDKPRRTYGRETGYSHKAQRVTKYDVIADYQDNSDGG